MVAEEQEDGFRYLYERYRRIQQIDKINTDRRLRQQVENLGDLQYFQPGSSQRGLVPGP